MAATITVTIIWFMTVDVSLRRNLLPSAGFIGLGSLVCLVLHDDTASKSTLQSVKRYQLRSITPYVHGDKKVNLNKTWDDFACTSDQPAIIAVDLLHLNQII